VPPALLATADEVIEWYFAALAQVSCCAHSGGKHLSRYVRSWWELT